MHKLLSEMTLSREKVYQEANPNKLKAPIRFLVRQTCPNSSIQESHKWLDLLVAWVSGQQVLLEWLDQEWALEANLLCLDPLLVVLEDLQDSKLLQSQISKH
jgi:hypothetical protein